MAKSRVRREEGLFVVSGQRELSRALEMDYEIESLFYPEEATEPEDVYGLEGGTFILSKKLFERISMRSGSEELIAILKVKNHPLNDLLNHQQNRVLVLEAPEKPGNIGALLRTAAAADWDAVIIANPKTDLYHPQVIRNSMGGVFSIPVALDSSDNVIAFLEKNNFNVFATSLQPEAKHYKRVEYIFPLAIVFGTEDKGLDAKWMKQAKKIIKIPVKFPIDSLNLSVSAGILMYHCEKQ